MQIRRGDTLVEVAFAIAVFALVSIICINLMNSGMNTAQESMEVTMTRNEMDAQAEAIRYIHNAFTLEREMVVEKQQYRSLWQKLTRDSNSGIEAYSGMANEPENVPELSLNSCSEIYKSGEPGSIINNSKITAFVMNTRVVDPYDETFMPGGVDEAKRLNQIIVSTKRTDFNAEDVFVETTLNPRVVFSNRPVGTNSSSDTDSELYESNYEGNRYVARAEGIWVIAVKDKSKSSGVINPTPEFFDFHIRSCWYAPGQSRPSTIGTIIRLYNPEVVENL